MHQTRSSHYDIARFVHLLIGLLFLLQVSFPAGVLATSKGGGGGGRDKDRATSENRDSRPPVGFTDMDLELVFSDNPGGSGQDDFKAIDVPPLIIDNFNDNPFLDPLRPISYDPINVNSVAPSDIVVLDDYFTAEEFSAVVVTTTFAGSFLITIVPAGSMGALGITVKAAWGLKATAMVGRLATANQIKSFWDKQLGNQ